MQNKQQIVMIHGFRGTHHGLLKIAENLPKDYELLIPDLPGFGEGQELDSYRLENYTNWLKNHIDQNCKKPPVLLGHSFGSIVCSQFAAQHPKAIDKLILVNPIGSPALEGPKKIFTQLAVFYYWLGSKLPEKMASKWLSAKSIVYITSTTMTKTKDKNLRKWIHSQHNTYFSRFKSPNSVLEAFKTSVSHNVADFADQISTKTLLIAGEKDDITPLKDQQKLVKLFPDAKLEVIPDVGHLTHYETPDKVADFVYLFVSSE